MKLKINDNVFKIKIASTPKERERGMMGKKFDENFDGMFFLQNSGHHCFWMKNCLIPLDIIFIEENKIKKIFHNCPPCEDECNKTYCSDGDFVLELEGGTCINLGIEENDFIHLI
jgi:uncharacterized membrane protein (UPF0127 family)